MRHQKHNGRPSHWKKGDTLGLVTKDVLGGSDDVKVKVKNSRELHGRTVCGRYSLPHVSRLQLVHQVKAFGRTTMKLKQADNTN